MFVTHAHDRLDLPSNLLKAPGTFQWRMVEIPFSAPWYIVSYISPDDAFLNAQSGTWCVWSTTELVRFLVRPQAQFVLRLTTVRPDALGLPGFWKYSEIEQLWRVQSGADLMLIFRDIDGEEYAVGRLFEESVPDLPRTPLLDLRR